MFIIKYIPSNILRRGKKILFAARDVHFSALSGMTSLTNKNVPFSVTTPKRSVILNELLNGGSS